MEFPFIAPDICALLLGILWDVFWWFFFFFAVSIFYNGPEAALNPAAHRLSQEGPQNEFPAGPGYKSPHVATPHLMTRPGYNVTRQPLSGGEARADENTDTQRNQSSI